jgi:hypothetical protein
LAGGQEAQAAKQGRLSALLKKVPAERRRACPSEAVARAGDHPQFAATFGAGFNINRKHPPEALSPSHRRGWVVGVDAPGSPRHDVLALLEVGREYTRDGFAPLLLTLRVRRAVTLACAVKAGEVQPGAWHECGESCHGRSCASLRPRHTVHPEHKIQRLQHHMGRAVPERLLVAVDHSPLAIDRQALGGDAFDGSRWSLLASGKPQPSPRLRWRSGDVAAQACPPSVALGSYFRDK